MLAAHGQGAEHTTSRFMPWVTEIGALQKA